MLLTNKDYTSISKSVADRIVVDLSVLIRSLASFAVSCLRPCARTVQNSPRIDIVSTG